MKTSMYRLYLFAAAGMCLAICIAAPLAADEPATAEDAGHPQPATVELQTGYPPNVVEVQTVQPLNVYSTDNLATFWRGLVTCSNSLIGIQAAAVDDVLRSHLQLAAEQGVIVTSVADDSPAARAGIERNDVLVTVGEQPIAGVESLQKLLQANGDKPTTIGLIRAGQKQSVEVTPQSPYAVTALAAFNEPSSSYWLGLGLAGADDTLRSQLGVAAGEGLVVTQVENDSPAAKAGVMVNDLLLKLDGKALATIEALTAQLQEIADKSATLELLRRGKPATLTVTPEQHAVPFFVNLTAEGVSDIELRAFTVTPETTLRLHDYRVLNVIAEQPAPDLAGRVAALLEQVKQLQKSLEEVNRLQQSIEALDAAIKAQAPPAVQEQKGPGESQ